MRCGQEAKSHLPPAEPEACRLLAPQRGLLANGLRYESIHMVVFWSNTMAAYKKPTTISQQPGLVAPGSNTDSRISQTLRVPQQSWGFTLD